MTTERRQATEAHREQVAKLAAEYVERCGQDYDEASDKAEAHAARFPSPLRTDVATLLRRRAETVKGMRV